MRALVLDFDGVISESAREAFAVALRTYAAWRPETRLRPVLDDLDPAHPERTPHYTDFLDLLPLGNRAEDYGVALAAMDEGVRLADQAAYDAYFAGFDPEALRAFHERFYQERERWASDDPEGWRRILAPYPPVIDFLRRRADEVELAIATAKDRRSVQALLRDYGIADLFPAERLLDKETGRSKRAHLQHLSGSLALPCAEITFVDDKVNHLDDVASLGVRCGLAAWGYNTPREHEIARQRGHLILTFENLDAMLFPPGGLAPGR